MSAKNEGAAPSLGELRKMGSAWAEEHWAAGDRTYGLFDWTWAYASLADFAYESEEHRSAQASNICHFASIRWEELKGDAHHRCCPHGVERHAYNGCANCSCSVRWPEHPDALLDPSASDGEKTNCAAQRSAGNPDYQVRS